MGIFKLLAAVNGARAREDFIYNRSSEFHKGTEPSPVVPFLFMGCEFQTELPYRLRLTEGVLLSHLNSSCYLIENGLARKVTFIVDASGDLSWYS